MPGDRKNNKAAWVQLLQGQQPFLCAFSDKDPVMSTMAEVLPALIPGAKGQPHPPSRKAGTSCRRTPARISPR